MAIMLTFIVGLALARPYQDRVSNAVKLATDISLFVTLVCALMLKGDLSAEAVDENDIDNAMLFTTVGLPAIAMGVGEAYEAYLLTQTALAAVKAKHAMKKAALARQGGSSEAEDVEEMQAMRELYDSIDVDGSGSLDRREILKLLQAMGEAMTPKEVTVAMRTMDPTRSGHVDFHGFHAWWTGRSDVDKAHSLSARAWAAVDVDGDGTLDPDEFKDVLERLGQVDGMAQEDFLELMQELDSDGDGVLDREEFLEWFGGLVDSGKTTIDEMTERFEAAEAARQAVEETLLSGSARAIDEDGMNDNPLFGGIANTSKDESAQVQKESPTLVGEDPTVGDLASMQDPTAGDPTADDPMGGSAKTKTKAKKKKQKKKKAKKGKDEPVIETENPIGEMMLDDEEEDT
jgi:Ca2+-binding EF-hand superfamily protein